MIAGCEQQLLDGVTDGFDRAVVAAGKFAHGAVEIGLASEQRSPVIEVVEVVIVVALLLEDLELDVFVIKVLIPGGRIPAGQGVTAKAG